MDFNTKRDKARNIVDLIQKFGERVGEITNPHHSEYDLQGAGRVSIDQEGLRRTFVIQAAGAEIHVGSWRGQIEEPKIVVGGEEEFNRIFENAGIVSEKIQEARDVAKALEAEAQRSSVPVSRFGARM